MGLRVGAGNRYVECRNHSLQPQRFPTSTSVPDAKAATAVPTNENLKRALSKFQLLSEVFPILSTTIKIILPVEGCRFRTNFERLHAGAGTVRTRREHSEGCRFRKKGEDAPHWNDTPGPLKGLSVQSQFCGCSVQEHSESGGAANTERVVISAQISEDALHAGITTRRQN